MTLLYFNLALSRFYAILHEFDTFVSAGWVVRKPLPVASGNIKIAPGFNSFSIKL